MSNQELQNQIIQLQSELAAIRLKSMAISLAFAAGGLYYAIKEKKSFWGKVGYTIGGSFLSDIPNMLIFSSQAAEKLGKIKQLQAELDAQNHQQS